MGVSYPPAPDEASSRRDQVLLEQWTTIRGRSLELRVTTAGATSPNAVLVQVRYGGGQAEVVAVAEESDSEARGQPSAVVETPACHVARPIAESEKMKVREEEDTTLRLWDATDRADEVSASASEEQEDTTPLAVGTMCETPSSHGERDDIAVSASSSERSDPSPVMVVDEDRAAGISAEHENISSPTKKREDSRAVARDTLIEGVNQPPVQPTNRSIPSDQKQQASGLLAVGSREKTIQPTVDIPGKESGLADQVADEALHAVDVRLAQYTELRIGRYDPPAVLDDGVLEKLLRALPALKCLRIDWREDGRKLNVDIVSRHCRNLVDLDLTRFRLDAWSLEQLCVACPNLEVVKLPRKCEDSCVEVLLRNLPRLRSLDLANTKVTGQFLGTYHESLQKLSLEGCPNLKIEHIDQALCSDENIPQTTLWQNIRELDMTSSALKSVSTKVLRYFPRLERLSLNYASNPAEMRLSQLALCEQLRDLGILHSSLDASDLQAILTQCSQLERLSLAHSSISNSSIQRQLDRSQIALRLRELDVTKVRGLATADLAAILSLCPQLERLRTSEFSNMELTTCLMQLRRCTKLRELDVSRSGTLSRIPPEQVETTNARSMNFSGQPELKNEQNAFNERRIEPTTLATLLSGCRKLERLVLAGCHISESSSLRWLAQCPELRELDLSRVTTGRAPVIEARNAGNLSSGYGQCRSMNTTDLEQALSGCPLLERLCVAGLEASLEQAVPPFGLPCLRYLDVSNSGLTNNSLRRLPGLFPRLHTLVIEGCSSMSEDGLLSYVLPLENVRSLDLRNVSGVSDAVLDNLKECQLTKLRLDGPALNQSITTGGLVRLVNGCQSLKYLWLEGSGDARVTIDAIRQRLPRYRTLVLVTGVERGRTRRPVTAGRKATDPRTGPLLVLKPGEIDWDKD